MRRSAAHCIKAEVPMTHLKPQHEKLLLDILTHYLPVVPLSVYMFGSRARQSPRPDSDLDLLLDVHGNVPLSTLAQLRDALEESDLPFRVDVVLRADVDPEFFQRIKDDLIPLGASGSET